MEGRVFAANRFTIAECAVLFQIAGRRIRCRNQMSPIFSFKLRKLLSIAAFFAAFCMPLRADVLQTARTLANTKYKGWVYGPSAAKHQVDCVQFVLAVVSEELKAPLNAQARKAILISHGWNAAQVQSFAEAGKEPRIAGVQYALVDVLKKGERIEPKNARPGDLIQYWTKRQNGKWGGHSAVISDVKDNMATLLGAHQSSGKVDENLKIDLLGKDRHVFIVRMKSAP